MQTSKRLAPLKHWCKFAPWLWDLRADLQQRWLASFGCITPRQRHSWPCYLPTFLLLSEGFLSEAGLEAYCLYSRFFRFVLCQVPEWTKCSSREKRKEKKVEKPFYTDSEGESGPTESADSGNFRLLALIAWSFFFYSISSAHNRGVCLCERLLSQCEWSW